jgi:hypothetical protein
MTPAVAFLLGTLVVPACFLLGHVVTARVTGKKVRAL